MKFQGTLSSFFKLSVSGRKYFRVQRSIAEAALDDCPALLFTQQHGALLYQAQNELEKGADACSEKARNLILSPATLFFSACERENRNGEL